MPSPAPGSRTSRHTEGWRRAPAAPLDRSPEALTSRPCVADAMALRATLDSDLPRQDPAPIEEDGEKRSGHLSSWWRFLACNIPACQNRPYRPNLVNSLFSTH